VDDQWLTAAEPVKRPRSTPVPRHARAGLVDLLAFFSVLVLAGGLALLVDRTGQLSARPAFAAGAGLVAACMAAWRRLRRLELRRWRSGQAIYHGRRVTVVSAWGVEGQPPPAAIEPSAIPSTTTPCAAMPGRADAGARRLGQRRSSKSVD
jgi:hypothetical protein